MKQTLIAFLAAALLATSAWTKEKRQLADEEIQNAYVVSVKCLSAMLKAPLTAVYAPIEEARFSPAIRNSIDVRFYVDSQNSFGAMLRMRVTCNVGPRRPDDTYKAYCRKGIFER